MEEPRESHNYYYRNILILGLMTILQMVMCSNIVFGQNKIDFGIFASALPNQMEIRIRPNYNEGGTHFLTNAQLTVKWPLSSGITSVSSGSPIFPFLLSPQGSPTIDNGYYYQIWATPGGSAISWTANQEIVVLTFTFANVPCPQFEIAHDNYVQNIINGDYYMEINGNSLLTGILYHSSAGLGPDTPGIIAGLDTVYAGMDNVSYSVTPVTQASSYTWMYNGTGANIAGIGDSVKISFSTNATSGNLMVAGHNACGNGPFSQAYMITIVNPVSIESHSNYNFNTKEIKIYPNPSKNSIIYLGFENIFEKDAIFEILNILSGVQKNYHLSLSQGPHSFAVINISDFECGFYLVRTKIADETYIGKIIKN